MNIQEMLAQLAEGRTRYEAAIRRQADVFQGRIPDRQPLLLSADLSPEQAASPAYDLKVIHHDPEKMLARELRSALSAMNGQREALPSVRANMGCGIVPALFGVEPLVFEDKQPWVKNHLSKERLQEMAVRDLQYTTEFQQGLAHMEYQARVLGDCGCRVYPLDIQGAVDTAHIVLGDDFFYELYDDPDFIAHLIALSCSAVELAFDECLKRIPGSEHTVAHYNGLAIPRTIGGLKLSEDTSTLLCEAHIQSYVVPSLKRLFAHSGGGYIHYCGKNAHLYQAAQAEPLAHALNFGNPDMHDMEAVLRECAAKGRVFYGNCQPRPDEKPEAYFRRILRAARDEQGRFWLLPSYHCKLQDLAHISDSFDEAVESLRQEVR